MRYVAKLAAPLTHSTLLQLRFVGVQEFSHHFSQGWYNWSQAAPTLSRHQYTATMQPELLPGSINLQPSRARRALIRQGGRRGVPDPGPRNSRFKGNAAASDNGAQSALVFNVSGSRRFPSARAGKVESTAKVGKARGVEVLMA